MPLNIQTRDLTPQQAMVIGFSIIILSGAILLLLPISSASGKSIGWINALFTATSAVSLTGLTVVDIAPNLSLFGQAVILILVKLGGLGFMLFGVMLALLLGKRITLKDRLLIQEATRAFSIQGMVKLVMYIVCISFLLEGLVAIILGFYWSPTLGWKQATYKAIFHAISAFNNSGLSLYPNSLQAYVGDPVVNLCITSLSIIGGIGFTVLLDVYSNRSWKKLSLHTRIVLLTSGILMLTAFILILAIEWFNPQTFKHLAWGNRLWAAWFQAVAPRSSGFYTVGITAMRSPTLWLIMLLMFVGTATGSTGGGIKVNTFAVAVIGIINVTKGNKDVNIFKKRINYQLFVNAIVIILLASSIIFLVTLLLTLIENSSQANSMAVFFEVVSAFTTTGLSMGITPTLSSIGKLILIATMFVGKIGPLTFAFALTSGSAETYIRYPEDKVLIG
ncbi:MAG: Ktr system potassium transporter B [Candidatus Amoebophilus sp. 36-38]|nr:MAG: Ktr system potassium transporter B [Candidatus Amoebophilus sp. 36-38]